MIVDLFAGPGGWDEGLAELGRTDVIGIEWDYLACLTARTARHRRIQADVGLYPPEPFDVVEGLIASPPCPLFSAAGSGVGRQALHLLGPAAQALLVGRDVRADVTAQIAAAFPDADAYSAVLVLEPARWIGVLRPRWVALEQVPPVLPVWRLLAHELRALGYSAWSGELNAADYGAPQARRRAILIASLDHPVSSPAPTHVESPDASLFAPVRPWRTMLEAVGWGYRDRPAPTVLAATHEGGRRGLDGGSRTWAPVRAAIADGTFVCPAWHDGSNRGVLSAIPTADLATLQTFRPDYPFAGNLTDQARQAGNAVPPVLARAVLAAALGLPPCAPG